MYRIVTDKKGYYYGQTRTKVLLFWTWKRFTFTDFETIEECEIFIAKKIERLKKEKELKEQAGKIIKYLEL
jgi:hypothetical protein